MRRVQPAFLLAAIAAGCLAETPGHLPSSLRVLYSRATEDSLGARTDIYFLVARSGNELQLTGEEAVDRQPVFAPRLRNVFYTREVSGRREIWSMELDGSGESVVLAADGVDFHDPAIAPGEEQIAYTRTVGGRSQVEIAGIDGSVPRPVEGAGGSSSQPAWSPDGQTLTVVGTDGATARLYLVDAAGGRARPLAPGDAAPQRDPDWSPDGSTIAFVRGDGAGAEIAIADVASGMVTPLTDNDVPEASPAWSPTGERIVFISRRPDGRDNLWVMDAAGDDLEAVTRRDEADASDPDWL